MKDFEKILKALANKRRLEILKYIKQKKEASVGDIAEHIKLSFKSTSRHLSILFRADILDRDQRGLLVFYHLDLTLSSLAKFIISKI